MATVGVQGLNTCSTGQGWHATSCHTQSTIPFCGRAGGGGGGGGAVGLPGAARDGGTGGRCGALTAVETPLLAAANALHRARAASGPSVADCCCWPPPFCDQLTASPYDIIV